MQFDSGSGAYPVFREFIYAFMARRDIEKAAVLATDDICAADIGTESFVYGREGLAEIIERGRGREEFSDFSIFDYRERELAPGAALCTCGLVAHSEEEGVTIVTLFARAILNLVCEGGEYRVACFSVSVPDILCGSRERLTLYFSGQRPIADRSRVYLQLYTSFRESSAGSIIGFYPDSNFPVYLTNGELLETLGYSYGDFLNGAGSCFIDLVHPDDRVSLIGSLVGAANPEQGYEIQCRVRRSDGEYTWIQGGGKRIPTEDGHEALVFNVADVSETVDLKKRLESEMKLDPLTRIYRMSKAVRLIEEKLTIFRHSALLLIDINNFKKFNEIYGASAGDEVLARLARIFRENIRKDDIFARVGGDDFMIFLEGARRREDTVVQATRLQRLFRDYFHARYPNISLGVSIGGVVSSGQVTFEQVYEIAERVLATVKTTSRESVRIEMAKYN